MKPRIADHRQVRVDSAALLATLGYARVPDEFRIMFTRDPDEWSGQWPVQRRYTVARAADDAPRLRRVRLERASIWLPAWAVELTDLLAGDNGERGWNREPERAASFSLAASIYVARDAGLRWRNALLTTARVSPDAAIEMVYGRALDHGLGRRLRAERIASYLYPEARAHRALDLLGVPR